jgi:hypothetical protein
VAAGSSVWAGASVAAGASVSAGAGAPQAEISTPKMIIMLNNFTSMFLFFMSSPSLIDRDDKLSFSEIVYNK